MRSVGLVVAGFVLVSAGVGLADQYCATDDCTGTLVLGCNQTYYIPCASSYYILEPPPCKPDERCVSAYFILDDIDPNLDCSDIETAFVYFVDDSTCTEQLVATSTGCSEECNGSRVTWPGTLCFCKPKPTGCQYGKVHILFRVFDHSTQIILETEPDNVDDICSWWDNFDKAPQPAPELAQTTWGQMKAIYR